MKDSHIEIMIQEQGMRTEDTPTVRRDQNVNLGQKEILVMKGSILDQQENIPGPRGLRDPRDPSDQTESTAGLRTIMLNVLNDLNDRGGKKHRHQVDVMPQLQVEMLLPLRQLQQSILNEQP